MAKVSEVIEQLSKHDPDEVVALLGWWLKSDVENNNDLELTEDEWNDIVEKQERDTDVHIDDLVSEFLREEL